jgi:Diacylglycerol kinase catalytic domain
MGSKQASIVVDLRTGKDVIHVPDLIAMLSAAGYKPDVALKAYGGETMKLAWKAARKGCDLIIGYGGDGTLNGVVNGVMEAGGKSRYRHWTWWINRPTLSRSTSGRFLVRRQSREAFSSQSEALSKFFC